MGVVVIFGCKEEEMDASEEEAPAKGDPCEPAPPVAEGDTGEEAEEQDPVCAEGLACEPLADSDAYVCAVPFEIHGMVIDALTDEPIEGALVAAMDETSAPVTDVVVTDADGNYVLPVSVLRDENGELIVDAKWRLSVSADGYLPFPTGMRPAIPIDTSDASQDHGGDGTGTGTDGGSTEAGEDEPEPPYVIENATTTVALIPLPEEEAGGVSVSGTVGGADPSGTLVVAEGLGEPAPYAVADLSGHYTLFNVPPGAATISGYRGGLELEPATVTVADADLEGVDLALVSEDLEELGVVNGSVNIVNAPGGSATSVVLIPTSVFNEPLERGPVPFGLRDPAPGLPVDVTSDFAIPGVPSGTYKVLAAFENDDLVRDPDESIAGTQIQEITLGFGESVPLDEYFKVTEALDVVSPGAEEPEVVTGTPTFVWADDSSEDGYDLVVFDALGNEVWRDEAVPGGSGSDTVEVTYGGDPLEPGMYYQFRATSFRDTPQGMSMISRTEDLRGVFMFGSE
jgi:hypothetical protein